MTSTPVSLNHYFLDKESTKLVEHFKNAFVMHQNVQDVFDQILKVITHPGEKTLVGVVGPSGVGKTALMQQIYKHLNVLSQFDPNWHEGRIACGKTTLSLQGSRVFDWTYFMTDCLNSLAEPLVGQKRNIASGNSELEDKIQEALRHLRKSPSGKVSDENKLTALFRSLIFACRNRKPYSLLHDEAQRISHAGSGRKLSDQLEAIVCLTDAAGTPFTFFGDYGFLDIADRSPHLSRRLAEIELRRYQFSEEYPDDEANFLNLVAGYQEEIRIDPQPDLVSNHIYLYQRSVGNPGMLKDWLVHTLVETLREGRPDKFLEHLEKTSPSDSNLIARLAQIKLGESRFKSNEQTEAKLNDELDITIRQEEAKAPSKRPSGRIGIPNPQRYDVGNGISSEDLLS